jgi:preprotein translocase subunit SecA
MRVQDETKDIADEAVRAERAAAIRTEVAEAKEKVKQAGGLFVIGSERHESRRIDNQLRGRSGRQGDPGASKFFLSLEDDLMRIFGSERMDTLLQRLGLEKGEAIAHRWINKALEKAQQKVEAHNFDARKNLLKYDDVMNDQRKVIYEQRIELMRATDVSETVLSMRHEVIEDMVSRAIPPRAYPDAWNTDGLHEEALRVLGLDLPISDWAKEEGIADEEIRRRILDAADRKMAEKAAAYGADILRMAEKSLLLQILDQSWKEHLLTLDHLRQGINLRAYAQRDPLNEYKSEAFSLFERMLAQLRENVTTVLMRLELRFENPAEIAPQPVSREMHEGREDPALVAAGAGAETIDVRGNTVRRRAQLTFDANDPATWGRVSRNAPCPCGSGKKYKQCHGLIA